MPNYQTDPQGPTIFAFLRLPTAYLLPTLLAFFWLSLAEVAMAKQAIGATAVIKETTSGASFRARVDTGAESCSLHVNQVEVIDGKPRMQENWGKKVRFSVTCSESNKQHWIDSKIQSTVIVKTSEKEERRYKAWVTFEYEGIEKKILVTLNDRSKMDYPLLIGRNFLKGDFVVDVELHATE